MQKKLNIAILGSGAWGTALANLMAEKDLEVNLWFFDKSAYKKANISKINPFLPTVKLNPNLKLSLKLEEILPKADVVLLTTPIQSMRPLLEKSKKWLKLNTILVNCSKGLEVKSGKLMHEIVSEILPKYKYAVLSGPSFAEEVGRGQETAVVLASRDLKTAESLQAVFGTPCFRPYLSTDVVGVETAGAYKNILAIGAGVIGGLGKGENLQAALIARGLNEMAKFGHALGAKRETFLGLAGVGDLILTASSHQSRNYSFGWAIGSGKDYKKLLTAGQPVVEGYYTIKSVLKRAKKHKINLTIVVELDKIINKKIKPDKAVTDLMRREWKTEF